MQIYERRVNALCRYIKNLFDKFYKIFCIFESSCTILMGTSFDPPNKRRREGCAFQRRIMDAKI